jgi:DNA-binding NarL/FixJ family response regulator
MNARNCRNGNAIVVLDIRLPPTFTDEGTRAAAEIKAAHPATGVLLLSQHVATAHTCSG